jgi:hypothetical protein
MSQFPGRFAAILVLLPALARAGFELVLPTDNRALLAGDGPAFYQYVDRDFRGEKSRPWQGGQYGFVRNPVEWGSGLVLTRFHEGIDIRPVKRGADGAPLDVVRAVSAGKVVHVSQDPRNSNYGRFVVVEHSWDGSDYYSLYAHLRTADVAPGQAVATGQPLGVMGWTGDGLDITRAHLHLEIGLRLSDRFEEWHAHYFPSDPNRHGLWNGLNLAGFDVAAFYLARQKAPDLTVPAFLATQRPAFRARIPAAANFSLVRRYPWLVRGDAGSRAPAAWEVAFSAGGVPLSAAPAPGPVSVAVATWAAPPRSTLLHATRGLVGGTVAAPRLTATGLRSVGLLTFPD